MKAVKIFLFGILFLFCSAFTLGVSSLSYDYYFEVNESNTILFLANVSNNSALINFNLTNYSMTKGIDYFSIAVSNPKREDVNFSVYLLNSTNETIEKLDGIMRFRVSFDVTIQIYKSSHGINSTVPFRDDFQYVYIQKLGESSVQDTTLKYLDLLNQKIGAEPQTLDSTLSLWADYSGGQGIIKVYEAGNYTLSLETTKTKSSIPWAYEFMYPQALGSKYSQSLTNLEIPSEENQIFKVYATAFEIDFMKAMLNIFLVVIVILVYVGLIILSFYSGNVGVIFAVIAFGGIILSGVLKSLL
jgi:hypothetical protein